MRYRPGSLFTAATISMLAAVPHVASADSVGEYAGTSAEEVAATLGGMGYRIEEIEHDDDDEIEVEAHRNGQEYEFEIDARSGRITEVDD